MLRRFGAHRRCLVTLYWPIHVERPDHVWSVYVQPPTIHAQTHTGEQSGVILAHISHFHCSLLTTVTLSRHSGHSLCCPAWHSSCCTSYRNRPSVRASQSHLRAMLFPRSQQRTWRLFCWDILVSGTFRSLRTSLYQRCSFTVGDDILCAKHQVSSQVRPVPDCYRTVARSGDILRVDHQVDASVSKGYSVQPGVPQDLLLPHAQHVLHAGANVVRYLDQQPGVDI